MRDLRRDPAFTALLTCVLLIVVGLVAIALGKRVVARTEDVYDQLPALVSGGIGGIALVVIGCIFTFVQVSRICSEREQLLNSDVLDEVARLTDVRRARLEAGHESASVHAVHSVAPIGRAAEIAVEVEETTELPVQRPRTSRTAEKAL